MSDHSPGSNCEEDFSEGTLTTYQCLFKMYVNDMTEPDEENTENRVADGLPKLIGCDSEIENNLGSQTKTYIAGYVIKKLNTTLFKGCVTCLSNICSESLTKDHNIIVARDYNPGKLLLRYPNAIFNELVQKSIDIIGHNIPSICHHRNLKVELTSTIVESLNVNIIKCADHGSLFPTKFFNFIIKVIVHNWCAQINRIMNGKIRLPKNETDQIKLNALCRYETFSKKKKY